jgi:hypothetical protein
MKIILNIEAPITVVPVSMIFENQLEYGTVLSNIEKMRWKSVSNKPHLWIKVEIPAEQFNEFQSWLIGNNTMVDYKSRAMVIVKK